MNRIYVSMGAKRQPWLLCGQYISELKRERDLAHREAGALHYYSPYNLPSIVAN